MRGSTLFRALFLPSLYRFLFTLFFLYGLYAFIDYSIRIQEITKSTADFTEILFFYLCSLSKRLEFLLPLSLLLSMIRTFMVMNERNELVGFLSCGISLKKISYPFFILSTLSSCLMLLNYEFFNPSSQIYIDKMEERISLRRSEIDSHLLITQHKLSNDTSCLFIKDPSFPKHFLDFYWFETPDSFWHAKEVSYDGKNYEGLFVDHLQRNEEGQFIKQESLIHYSFPQLTGVTFKKANHFTAKECSSLSSIIKEISHPTSRASNEILGLFYYRLTMILLPFLIFCTVIPSCTRFTKAKEYYLLFAFYLFGFISFFTLMDAFYILASQGILHSALAMLGMPIVLALIFGLQLKQRYA